MITEVKIYPLKKDNAKIKANGTVVFDHKYKVRVTVRNGDKGLWLGLPGRFDENKKDDKGRAVWYSDFQTITKEAYKELHDTVMKAYSDEIGGQPVDQGAADGPTNQDATPDGDNPPF